MSSAKITSLLAGVPDLARKLQLMDATTRARTIAAVERGTKAVAAQARLRAPRVTDEMASTIRDEYSPDKLVGFVKVGMGKLPRRSQATTDKGKRRFAKIAKQRKVGRGAYAPVVERGDPRRHHKAHPFLIPSLVDEKPTIIADLAQATKDGAAVAGGA